MKPVTLMTTTLLCTTASGFMLCPSSSSALRRMTSSLQSTNAPTTTRSTEQNDMLVQLRNEIDVIDMPISSQRYIQQRVKENKSAASAFAEVSLGRIAMVGWVCMTGVEAITGKSLPEQVMEVFSGTV